MWEQGYAYTQNALAHHRMKASTMFCSCGSNSIFLNAFLTQQILHAFVCARIVYLPTFHVIWVGCPSRMRYVWPTNMECTGWQVPCGCWIRSLRGIIIDTDSVVSILVYKYGVRLNIRKRALRKRGEHFLLRWKRKFDKIPIYCLLYCSRPRGSLSRYVMTNTCLSHPLVACMCVLVVFA